MENFDAVLARAPLFAGISADSLRAMLACLNAQVKQYPKGGLIFREGDPARSVGVVLSGFVQVVKEDYFGNRSVVAALGPAQLFAEVFSCAGVAALPVSVLAHTDAEVMLLDCQRVLTVCGSACPFHSVLIRNLLRAVAAKNLVLNQKIELMSKKTTKEKLMAFLLAQAKEQRSDCFTIPFDRQSLADYLGVERSAMSAELGKLRDMGYIEADRRRFRILKKPESL